MKYTYKSRIAKSTKTMTERYGVDNASKSEEVKQKKVLAAQKKYGVNNVSQAEEVKNKKKLTLNKHFWSDNLREIESIRKKIEETNLKKYWVINPWQSEELNKKRDETMIKKYGNKNPRRVKEIDDKRKATCLKKYWHENPLSNPKIQQKALQNLKKNHPGYENPMQLLLENPNTKTDSKVNQEWRKLLGVPNTNKEFSLEGFYYDIKIDNVLIEINPFAYHNMTRAPLGEPKNRLYHLNKSRVARKNWYQCVHIFDWDNPEKIRAIYSTAEKKKYYARELKVREAWMEETKELLEKYHLQNDTYSHNRINLWLFDWDQLVMVTTWGVPRYTKSIDRELLRLCTRGDSIVVGGFERLFKHFISTYNPKSIISYCDMAKFNWDVYRKVWMKEYKSSPSIHYYHPRTKEHYMASLINKRWIDNIFAGRVITKQTIFDKSIFKQNAQPNLRNTLILNPGDKLPRLNELKDWWIMDNERLMECLWFVRIADCWQNKFIRTNPLLNTNDTTNVHTN